jgi:autophagy-related protein 2
MSSSWWPQWLSGSFPSLPSIGLPSNLQAKFLSFVLRRSLGRFLRPGQLDAERIDSQIGSGYVQVTKLELDEHVSIYLPHC